MEFLRQRLTKGVKRLALISLTTLAAGFVPNVANAADEAAIVHGGRLYDDWMRESKVRAPNGPQPSFPAAVGGVTASDTWRCKECHGFDYKGNHGMPGIRARQGGDPNAIVTVLKNNTHKYGGLISDRDLFDIASFVSHGQLDMQATIESWKRSKTPVASVEKHFGTICAGCHDLDGRKLRGIPPLGDLARQRPSEVLHSVLFGHAGGEMPALLPLGTDMAARMLAYLQSLPGINLSASIAHGGRLYDDWQLEEGAKTQGLPHPAYPASADPVKDVSATWRCRTCHGWDYKGNQGDAATGTNPLPIKGIRGMAGAEPAKIAALLRNRTHQYGAVLQDRDIVDLANFVSQGQLDMDTAIERGSRRFLGNSAQGSPYYRAICASCHGLDGKRITASLGRAVKRNPYSALHMALNGHPDEKMPALRELDPQIAIDILTYLQDLP